MQRDVGNEVIIAIVAIGVLAFAVIFAIVFLLSGMAPDAATTATAMVSAVTDTPVPPTTALPSLSSVETEATSVTATITLTATTVTNTSLPTTSTPKVETLSATTQAPSATNRPIKTATSTPSPSPTRIPSRTPTRTPTPTLTKTPTPTLTASATATRTPRPTETSGIRSTPTGTLTPVSAAVPTLVCVQPLNWVPYNVQPGETLFSIAMATGSSLTELQTANCLTNVNSIYAGQMIIVPRLPLRPVTPPITGGPPPPPGSGLYVEGCTDPSTQITGLTPGQTVSGVITLRGTASLEQFWYYKLEVRPDFAQVYNFYSRSDTPVVGGVLGTIDTKIFGSGAHWIRLTVVDIGGGYPTPCAIPVIFQ